MIRIRRALISVTDKTGVADFARELHAMGVEVLSTGGTARALTEAGLKVLEVADFTGFPEMLDGRVKTLHPKVHAGILFRRDLSAHVNQMAAHHLKPIDLVCVNLYAFEATVARQGVTLEEAIENIDIGGPTLLRAAAKNYASVTVVIDPADYGTVLAEMRAHEHATTLETRFALARKVFASTSAYDAAITSYLRGIKKPE
jgi:phosphoribosylaminoimidazolecarboxamide formyltransferase/IMP cyclohydrolase